MSAFLCTPEHIGALATYSIAHRHWVKINAQDLAKLWARANLASVACRYQMTEDAVAEEFGGWDDAQQYVWECQQETHKATALLWAGQDLTFLWAYKMAACLDYQCCEVPNWRTDKNDAEFQIRATQDAAIQEHPEYDRAPWELQRSEQLAV